MDANYLDMGVVQEFVQGTSLVGEVEQCGWWSCLRLVSETKWQC